LKLASHSVALRHHFETAEQQKDASTIGMWMFLVTEIMFFGGLFMTYIAYRGAYPDAFAAASQKLNTTEGFINTLVLICSSLTMAMAVRCAAQGKKKAVVWLLFATMLFGLAFLGIKADEYTYKFQHHEVPGANFAPEDLNANVDHASLYFALYFGMTGLHAFHMIVGIGILCFILRGAMKGIYTPAWHTPVELFGLYWHFVDIVWIFLFPLLYLIDVHKGK
jgi:cytochrome c oxidase subunit 3